MSTVFGLPLLNWKLDAPYSGDKSDECGWIPACVGRFLLRLGVGVPPITQLLVCA